MRKTLLAFITQVCTLFGITFFFKTQPSYTYIVHPPLLLFFVHLNKWLEEGMPEDVVFTKDRPTCMCLSHWVETNKEANSDVEYNYAMYLYEHYGSYFYPFNTSYSEVRNEVNTKSVWENPLRIKAAKDALEHFSLALATKEM